MTAKKQVSGKFKSKGTSILHTGKDGPYSMHEFLLETDKQATPFDNKSCTNTQNHKDTIELSHEGSIAQTHNYGNNQKSTEENNSSPFKIPRREALERIHVQIRKELADKLIETVYARKREGQCKKKDATQRQIIEQALEEYFEKEGF